MSNYDKDKIRSAIQSMTAICDKGKAEVTKLVESIIGDKLGEPVQFFVGGIYENRYHEKRLLCRHENDTYSLVCLNREERGHVPCRPVSVVTRSDMLNYILREEYGYLGLLGEVPV